MSNTILLTAPEAACLSALRAGKERKPAIALDAGLTIGRADQALIGLLQLHLVTNGPRRVWRITSLGQDADVAIKPVVRTRGRLPNTSEKPGRAASRLLALLDRPRRGIELVELLSVSRQRIHQMISDLAALRLIRLADPAFPTFLVTRHDDPSLLLRPDQERVLSVFRGSVATTLAKIAEAVQMPIGKVRPIAGFLQQAGLIETAGAVKHGDLYRQTAAGAAHWQRSARERPAGLYSLQFRSSRVLAVFACLDRDGPIRTRDVGLALGIPQPVINGLMQNLKRKGMVRTATAERHSPYVLTADGVEMLAAMRRLADGEAAMA